MPGSGAESRTLSRGFTVLPNMLTLPRCAEIVERLREGQQVAGRVLRAGKDELDERLRRCSEHSVDALHSELLTEVMLAAARECLVDDESHHFRLDGPKVCSYLPGGYFRAHTDRSVDSRDLKRVRRRSLSMVCLLNDHRPRSGLPGYDGGTLVLHVPRPDGSVEALNMPAAAGAVVAFRSELMHEVRPVRSGVRWSAVGWMFALDGEA